MTFKEGGAFDFSNIYERIKERLQQAVEVARESGHITGDGSESGGGRGAGGLQGVDLNSVHLEELPAYEEQNTAVPLSPPPAVERNPTPPRSDSGSGSEDGHHQKSPTTRSPTQATFDPPAEPPPGYEEVQRESVADELERQLRGSR